MGKALSGKLSCPCDKSCFLVYLTANIADYQITFCILELLYSILYYYCQTVRLVS